MGTYEHDSQNAGKKTLRYDPLIVAGLAVYFGLLAIGARDFPPDARSFPMAVALAGTMVSLVLLWGHRHRLRRSRSAICTENREAPRMRLPAESHPFLIVGLYLLVAYLVGYVISTLLLALLLPRLLGSRGTWSVLAFAVILLMTVWSTFHLILRVRFPAGLLGIF